MEPRAQFRDRVMAEAIELIDESEDQEAKRHDYGIAEVIDLIDQNQYPGVKHRDGMVQGKKLIDDNHFRVPNVAKIERF